MHIHSYTPRKTLEGNVTKMLTEVFFIKLLFTEHLYYVRHCAFIRYGEKNRPT